jgi:nucleotide-binding universal stress UspA family protein
MSRSTAARLRAPDRRPAHRTAPSRCQAAARSIVQGADAIAAGMRGAGGVGQALRGPVASALPHTAPRPLVVPGDAAQRSRSRSGSD